MSEWKRYVKSRVQELRRYVPGEELDGVSVSPEDRAAGSPKEGDMIARNSDNHADMWLVSARFFVDNYEEVL